MSDKHSPVGSAESRVGSAGSPAGLARVSPESVGLCPAGLQRLGERLQADIDAQRIAGAVVLIARRQQCAYFEAFGFQDRERGLAMRTDCIFRIASMTKPVAAVAALLLMEQGLLALIDPIHEYLPEFKHAQVGLETTAADGSVTLALAPVARPISIQDLFRHTAGLSSPLFGGSLIKRRYQESGLRDDQQTLAAMVATLARLPLLHQPGTTFEYGMSTDVLGRIVEVVSGSDLNSFILERIARPLGMADTSFVLTSDQAGRLALPQPDPANSAQILPAYDPAKPPLLYSGSAGLLSTAWDFARFAQMLANRGQLAGTRLLSHQTVQLMLSDHLPPTIAYGPNTRALGITAPLAELGQGYGLGVGIRTRPGLSCVPGSVGDFYWGGALGTYFWVDPQEELIAILMMQESDAAVRARYRSVFRNLVYHSLLD